MKKLLLTAAAVLMSLSVYAQGTVAFANNASTLVTDVTMGNAAVLLAQGIVVGLYWAPLSDPLNFRQIGNSASVGVPIAGRYNAGTRSTGPETAATQGAKFQVRAWELAYGSTYEAAVAAPNMGGRPAKRGNSNIIDVTKTGNGSSLPPEPLTSYGLQGFAVDVPEPSVIALGVIGAGALLLLRRRK